MAAPRMLYHFHGTPPEVPPFHLPFPIAPEVCGKIHQKSVAVRMRTIIERAKMFWLLFPLAQEAWIGGYEVRRIRSGKSESCSDCSVVRTATYRLTSKGENLIINDLIIHLLESGHRSEEQPFSLSIRELASKHSDHPLASYIKFFKVNPDSNPFYSGALSDYGSTQYSDEIVEQLEALSSGAGIAGSDTTDSSVRWFLMQQKWDFRTPSKACFRYYFYTCSPYDRSDHLYELPGGIASRGIQRGCHAYQVTYLDPPSGA